MGGQGREGVQGRQANVECDGKRFAALDVRFVGAPFGEPGREGVRGREEAVSFFLDFDSTAPLGQLLVAQIDRYTLYFGHCVQNYASRKPQDDPKMAQRCPKIDGRFRRLRRMYTSRQIEALAVRTAVDVAATTGFVDSARPLRHGRPSMVSCP